MRSRAGDVPAAKSQPVSIGPSLLQVGRISIHRILVAEPVATSSDNARAFDQNGVTADASLARGGPYRPGPVPAGLNRR